MIKCLLKLFLFLALLPSYGIGQGLAFRHLTVKDGLSASGFWHLTFDENGFFWLASNDGLYRYDGYNVMQFFKETHPTLASDATAFLYCGKNNSLWVCTDNGLNMIDENLQVHSIIVHDTLARTGFDFYFEAGDAGSFLINGSKAYRLAPRETGWEEYPWLSAILKGTSVLEFKHFNPSQVILSTNSGRVLIADLAKEQLLLDVKIPNALGICKVNDKEIMVTTDRRWGLYRLGVVENAIVEQFDSPIDQRGDSIRSGCVSMSIASDGIVYIATRLDGLISFDPKSKKFHSYKHHAADEQSLVSNGLRKIVTDKQGNLVISSSKGVSFTNVNYNMFRQLVYFLDKRNSVLLDDAINGITSDSKGIIWALSTRSLLKLNPGSTEVEILRDLSTENRTATNAIIPGGIGPDQNGNIWVSFGELGIHIYRDNGTIFKKLDRSNTNLPSFRVRILKKYGEHDMLIGTEDGLFRMNINTFQVDTFKNEPALRGLLNKRIIDILPIGDELWIAVSPRGGAYQYNKRTGKMKLYTTKNGLISDRVYCLANDKLGNIYIGSRFGLSIIGRDSSIKNFTKVNGLLGGRVENIISDDSGYIWMTNNVNVTRYDPGIGQLTHFDQRNGVHDVAFVLESAHRTATGEIYFGTSRGIMIVNPRIYSQNKFPLKVLIQRTEDGKNYTLLKENTKLVFEHDQGKISFQLSASDLIGNQQLFFRYMMKGLDSTWSAPTRNRSISYQLSSGTYRFEAEATYDGMTWTSSETPVDISVEQPFWQRWWFYLLLVLAAVALTYSIVRTRQYVKQKEKKLEELNREMNETRLMAIRAQMNPHFIFNSLNAIQECIVTEKVDAAYDYLSKFSRLLRLVLHNSEKNFIPLQNEIEMIRLYLSLESLRFRQSFNYHLDIKESIDEEVQVPSLLLQPYVENAVWHGLRHKQGEKTLNISFTGENHHLVCVIEDNGVGRERSAMIKKQKLGAEQFESRGSLLSQYRIDILNRQFPGAANVEIVDLKDEANQPKGTRVIISLPIQMNKN